MATATETQLESAGQKFVFWGMDWQFFQSLSAAIGDRSYRLAFDGANLEVMSPSAEHESGKCFLAALVETLALEMGIPIKRGGSTTFRSEELEKAIEADNCYWVKSEEQVRGIRRWKQHAFPPPDLALEIDVTHSSLDRLGIYAALRIPEIWRFDGEALQVLVLHPGGEFAPSELSAAFPFLPVQELIPFLHLADEVDETTCLRRFVEWIRGKQFRVQE